MNAGAWRRDTEKREEDADVGLALQIDDLPARRELQVFRHLAKQSSLVHPSPLPSSTVVPGSAMPKR